MRIVSVGQALPEYYYDQNALLAALKLAWGHRFHNPARLDQIHRNVQVKGRYLAQPIERYHTSSSFTESNNTFIRVAVDLGARAIQDALAPTGLSVTDIDQLIFVSSTGIATPSIDARLINAMGLRSDIRRTPLFGLGCMAGAGGLARLSELLRANPRQVGVLLSVELCSLTLQREDLSIANIVSSGLFGDGAAAALMVGSEHALAQQDALGPTIVASRSIFYPNTEAVMGWDIGSDGFGVVLSADVPEIVEQHAPQDVGRLLADHHLTREDIASYVLHPGGPKVLRAFEKALGLSPKVLALSYKTLAELGNLSSASVLMVLRDVLANRDASRPSRGAHGLLGAMGPGFCSEWVILSW
ncbi:MAG: type III polyketide synthase [Deltaproteobacteria bacterium]|nr:type III polyketide synthase [Deltaproteobacteria bacterium]